MFSILQFPYIPILSTFFHLASSLFFGKPITATIANAQQDQTEDFLAVKGAAATKAVYLKCKRFLEVCTPMKSKQE